MLVKYHVPNNKEKKLLIKRHNQRAQRDNIRYWERDQMKLPEYYDTFLYELYFIIILQQINNITGTLLAGDVKL